MSSPRAPTAKRRVSNLSNIQLDNADREAMLELFDALDDPDDDNVGSVGGGGGGGGGGGAIITSIDDDMVRVRGGSDSAADEYIRQLAQTMNLEDHSKLLACQTSLTKLHKRWPVNTDTDAHADADADDNERAAIAIAIRTGETLLDLHKKLEDRIGELGNELLAVHAHVTRQRDELVVGKKRQRELVRRVRALTAEQEDMQSQLNELIVKSHRREQSPTKGHRLAAVNESDSWLDTERQLRAEVAKERRVRGELEKEVADLRAQRANDEDIASALRSARDDVRDSGDQLKIVSLELATCRQQLAAANANNSNQTTVQRVAELEAEVRDVNERYTRREEELSETRQLLDFSAAQSYELSQQLKTQKLKVHLLTQRNQHENHNNDSSSLQLLATATATATDADNTAASGTAATTASMKNREFFFLLVLSVRKRLDIRYKRLGLKLPESASVSQKDLYLMAMEQQVPFYYYYHFIEKQMDIHASKSPSRRRAVASSKSHSTVHLPSLQHRPPLPSMWTETPQLSPSSMADFSPSLSKQYPPVAQTPPPPSTNRKKPIL